MVFNILRFAFLGLAVLFLIGSIIFLLRALRLRTSSRSETYNVLRLNQRRSMVNQAFGSVGFLVLALVFFAVGGIMSARGETAEEPPQQVVIPSLTPSKGISSTESVPEVSEETTPEPPSTAVVEPTEEQAAISNSEPPTPTIEPTSTVAPTATLTPALVNSPIVGLYLRLTPGGEIIERLDDQVEVRLLGDDRNVDGLAWVLVSAPSGNQGWVALDFLLIGQTAEDAAATAESATPTPEGEDGGSQDG